MESCKGRKTETCCGLKSLTASLYKHLDQHAVEHVFYSAISDNQISLDPNAIECVHTGTHEDFEDAKPSYFVLAQP